MFKGVNTFASSLSHPSEGVTGKRKKVTPKEIGCKIEVIYSRLLALASDSTNPVYLPPPPFHARNTMVPPGHGSFHLVNENQACENVK